MSISSDFYDILNWLESVTDALDATVKETNSSNYTLVKHARIAIKKGKEQWRKYDQ